MMSRSLAHIPVCLGAGSYQKLRCAQCPVTGETLVCASYLPLSTVKVYLSTDRPSTRSSPAVPAQFCHYGSTSCSASLRPMMVVEEGDKNAVTPVECMGLPARLAHFLMLTKAVFRARVLYSVPSLWAMTSTGWYGANPFP